MDNYKGITKDSKEYNIKYNFKNNIRQHQGQHQRQLNDNRGQCQANDKANKLGLSCAMLKIVNMFD